MNYEPDILVWINKETGGQERKQREIMGQNIFVLMTAVGHREASPEVVSRGLAEAIAEYVAYAICGNVYEREK